MLQITLFDFKSCCQSDTREEMRFSLYARISFVAVGTITMIVGCLGLCQMLPLGAWGTTAGASLLPIGFCLTLVGACIKCLKNQTRSTAPSNTVVDRPVFQTEQIIDDIWLSIFSLLEPSEVISSSMVCKN